MTLNPWAALAAALLLTPVAATAAPAAKASGPKTSVSRTETLSATVTIQSIDQATRHVTVTNAAGERYTLKAPPEVQNFDQLKVGDTIRTRYVLSTDYVLSKPNTPLPTNRQTITTVAAAKGDPPAGAAENRIVVSGAVVGVDRSKHTLKLVNPQGGEVYNIAVQRLEGMRALEQVKVGDKITAYITESLLIAVEP